jgi:hypothetical protein
MQESRRRAAERPNEGLEKETAASRLWPPEVVEFAALALGRAARAPLSLQTSLTSGGCGGVLVVQGN